jgi:hypothetical protein
MMAYVHLYDGLCTFITGASYDGLCTFITGASYDGLCTFITGASYDGLCTFILSHSILLRIKIFQTKLV